MMPLFIFNNLNILFLLMMFFSSTMAVSSSNWLGAWVGLELNMLSFIPIMIENKNMLSNESALKYFLVQASASAMFLMFCLMNAHLTFSFSNLHSDFPQELLLTIPLMIKLGASPFHTWFIMIMEGMNWIKCFLLMGWQKVAPLFILMYMTISVKFIVTFAALSLYFGSIGALNHTALRKIMAFSSVNHIGWMFSAMIISKTMMITYFLFYIMMNLFIIINLAPNSIYSLNQINNSGHPMPLLISLLSLGGLPPFLGFLPKWLVIEPMIHTDKFLLCFIMIMTALITLFYYLRITFCTLTMSSISNSWPMKTSYLKQLTSASSFLMLTTMTSLVMFNLILI